MKNMDSKVKPENLELIAKLVESLCVAERALLCMGNIRKDVVLDALQDTFLNVLKNIDRFESGKYKNFDAVIKKMAWNAGFDCMRRLERHRKIDGTSLPDDVDVVDGTETALDDCDMFSQREHIEKLSEQLRLLITGLNKMERTLFFSYINGKKLVEVAREVGKEYSATQSDRRRLGIKISDELGISLAELILLLTWMKTVDLIDEADTDTNHNPNQPR